MKIVIHLATGNKQATPKETVRHIQFFNSCNPYTQETIARIQNQA